VERASARASVMTDRLHQGGGEDAGLLRMAVFLQRAVLSRSAVANTITFAISAKFRR
jgi:hypothetical protein